MAAAVSGSGSLPMTHSGVVFPRPKANFKVEDFWDNPKKRYGDFVREIEFINLDDEITNFSILGHRSGSIAISVFFHFTNIHEMDDIQKYFLAHEISGFDLNGCLTKEPEKMKIIFDIFVNNVLLNNEALSESLKKVRYIIEKGSCDPIAYVDPYVRPVAYVPLFVGQVKHIRQMRDDFFRRELLFKKPSFFWKDK